MIYRILVNVPAVFLGLFCGAWSDVTGRKLPMMIPSLGSILAVVLYMMGMVLDRYTIVIIMLGAMVQVSGASPSSPSSSSCLGLWYM